MKNNKIFKLKTEYHADILVHSSIKKELKLALNDAERKVEYLHGKIKSNNYELWEILHKATSRDLKNFNLRFNPDKMILEEFEREENTPDIPDFFKGLGFIVGPIPNIDKPGEDEEDETQG